MHTELSVSGFADEVPPSGNLFIELEVDGTHRHRCVVERQSEGKLVSESLSDVALYVAIVSHIEQELSRYIHSLVTPSSFIDCELWYESEDRVNKSKLCECTVKITEAVCQSGAQFYRSYSTH